MTTNTNTELIDLDALIDTDNVLEPSVIDLDVLLDGAYKKDEPIDLDDLIDGAYNAKS